jgi:hypothetical protein
LDGFLGVGPKSVEIALAHGICDLGAATLVEVLGGCGRWAVPLLNHTLAFALQLRRSAENLSQGSRLRCLLRDSLGWPREHQFTSVARGYFSQPSVGRSAFKVVGLKGSPHQLALSRNSVNALMWSAKNGITKSS